MDINCNYMKQVNYWDLITDGTQKKVQVRPEMVGKKFNRLTIISSIAFKPDVVKMGYLCFASCSCGSNPKPHRYQSIKDNNTKSCGCHKSECDRKRLTTNGLSHTRLYRTWSSMLKRCYSKTYQNPQNYGDRGIKVVSEWHDMHVFFEWANQNGYQDDLELDRIDVNGNYCPENCRFITRQQNSMNRRGNPNSTSKYKGVLWHKKMQKWVSRISMSGKQYHIGVFLDEKEAALAYNKKALELFGEYAYLNKIDNLTEENESDE